MKIYIKAASISKSNIQTIKQNLFLYYGIMKSESETFFYDFDKIANAERNADKMDTNARVSFYKKYLPFARKCREIMNEIEKNSAGHMVDELIRLDMQEIAQDVVKSFPYEWAYYIADDVNASKQIFASRENLQNKEYIFNKILNKDLWIRAYVHDYKQHYDALKWIKIFAIDDEHYSVYEIYNPTKPLDDNNTIARYYRKCDVRPMNPIEIRSSQELFEEINTEVARLLAHWDDTINWDE